MVSSFEEVCGLYIAFLRSIYLQHKNDHWRAKGANFYGDHLLLDRIAETAEKDADLAAEKLIGVYSEEVLDLSMQAEMIHKTLQNFTSGDPIETSLAIETKFLAFSEKFYKLLEKEGKMTLGVDDMIMSIASHREEAVYLLKQASGVAGFEGDSKRAARVAFLKRIKKAVPTGQGFDYAGLERRLLTQMLAVVPSYVQGRYEAQDIQVSVDPKTMRIIANIKLPKPVSPDMQRKIEDNFKATTLNLLPDDMKNSFVIGVGFAMPPMRALPAKP
jgi:DNA-binding ferritin-like protein